EVHDTVESTAGFKVCDNLLEFAEVLIRGAADVHANQAPGFFKAGESLHASLVTGVGVAADAQSVVVFVIFGRVLGDGCVLLVVVDSALVAAGGGQVNVPIRLFAPVLIHTGGEASVGELVPVVIELGRAGEF